MHYPDAYFLVSDIGLKAEDFYTLQHQQIFQAMVDIAKQGLEIEFVNINKQLRKANATAAISYLSSITDKACLPNSVAPAAKEIKELAAKRKLANMGLELYQSIEEDESDLEAIAGKYIGEFSTVTPRPSTLVDASQAVNMYETELDARSSTGLAGYPIGLPSFDEATKGIRKISLVTLAANSGTGKTTFALQMLHNLAQQGLKCLYFSLEMGPEELVPKLLPMLADPQHKINYDDLDGELKDPTLRKEYEELGERFKKLPIWIDYGSSTIDSIKLVYQKLQTTTGVDVVFVDHLHLLTHRKNQTPKEGLDEITSTLKNIARTNRTPVILLSQFNREGVKSGGKPQKFWLKGTSNIETDSDLILFLYKEDLQSPESTLTIEKFRQAPKIKKFELNLLFNEKRQMVYEASNNYLTKPKPKPIRRTEDDVGF
jgi:replicative DNA helicase